ncbi:ThiF family protein [Roseimicrobium gellanilyticum]|uniref:ThiF family protein n=1 Tax=Roseimicrobium gellanilyticum TaxID=748857 RepID=A0A366HCD2_9BACT|nr:ThiF family adenylyltransferase [Roseimicrobium gellanilyticum]RBP39630.1 ThiF family protein [Roseimicrobium gellanilyticum]
MSEQLIDLSPDLRRLRNEGYEVEVRGSYLLVSHVPYVDQNKKVLYGILVSDLDLAGNRTAKPRTHVIHFIGAHPCNRDGRVISPITHASERKQLMEGLVVEHSFSNKPKEGYPDYYEKVTRYIEIISAPAKSIDEKATATTFRVIPSTANDSVFYYLDTNSSRGEIEAISAKLKGLRIGIIGLGGTGSYVLDLVAKTPVAEIHLFDVDPFAQHNAFRSPGAPTLQQLELPQPKVAYFSDIYGRMRQHIVPHEELIHAENVHELEQLDFVFICVDDGPARAVIVDFLESREKSFIDVGMGIQVCDGKLLGSVRVTASTPSNREHFGKVVSFQEARNDDYHTNIQIAELNMLNAALAVLKWKKLCGFYQDFEEEHHTVYSINDNLLLGEYARPSIRETDA